MSHEHEPLLSTDEEPQFFLATHHGRTLFCKHCGRSTRPEDRSGAVPELKAAHVCGPVNGGWS